MEDYSSRRQFWSGVVATKLGRGKMAAELGYADTNYLNQVVRGHTPLGTKNARKWERKLSLEEGALDKPIPEDAETNSLEVDPAVEQEFETLMAQASDKDQLEAIMRIAGDLPPKDVIRLARYLLMFAESGL